jgi:hypothetical protein
MMKKINTEGMSYDELFVNDYVYNGVVAKELNQTGQCYKTVCPECAVDDFTHVEGCSKLKLIEDI